MRNFLDISEAAQALLRAVSDETGPRRPGHPKLVMILEEDARIDLHRPQLEYATGCGIY